MRFLVMGLLVGGEGFFQLQCFWRIGGFLEWIGKG
jgi:hypothetical protein